MTNYELAYKALLIDVLHDGETVATRTGKVKRLFNTVLKVDLQYGFPLITGRKMFFKNVLGEAEWMLSGSTNVKDLHKYGVHIWDKWANSEGDLGPTYGAQLAKQWSSTMLKIVVEPYSRRLIINLWAVDQINEMALPPCYHTLQFYVHKGRLNMAVSSRSSDAAVGLPYDIATLAYLLLRACQYTMCQPGRLVFSAVDMHVNVENIDSVNRYLCTEIYPLPKFSISNYCIDVTDYEHGPHIPMTIKE